MNKKSKNQKGFTLLEATLIVLTLAVICFGGYYVWHSQHNVKSSKSATLPSSTATSSTKTTASTKTSITKQVVSQHYLTITQLGIKLPLSTGISDLIYTYTTSGGPILFFSTTSLDDISPSCTITPSVYSPMPFGRVSASTTPYPASEVGPYDGQVGTLYSHVNGYYLYWQGAQSNCQATQANNGQPGQNELNMLYTQLSLFKVALKNAVAD
jgi:Tfp pilus assembly protein PilV